MRIWAGWNFRKGQEALHKYETFDIGMDTGSPVSPDYQSPNAFTGNSQRRSLLTSSPLSLRNGAKSKKLERDVKFRKAMSD